MYCNQVSHIHTYRHTGICTSSAVRETVSIAKERMMLGQKSTLFILPSLKRQEEKQTPAGGGDQRECRLST